MSCVTMRLCQALFVGGMLHFGKQIEEEWAIHQSTSFLHHCHTGARDTLCKIVWMQPFQENEGQYGQMESSILLALPKCRAFHLQLPIVDMPSEQSECSCLLNISGFGSDPAVWSTEFYSTMGILVREDPLPLGMRHELDTSQLGSFFSSTVQDREG